MDRPAAAGSPSLSGMPDPRSAPRYVEPGWFTRNVFNRAVAGLSGLGLSVWGAQILRVRGRRSGEWRETPVNVLVHEGQRYLVAPRGETQWVRNLRAAGGGELRIGRTTEAFDSVEVPVAERVDVLRAYLRRWKAEVGVLFDEVTVDSPDEDFRRIADRYPVFHLGPGGDV